MNKTHIAMMSAAMLLASCSTNNGNQDAGDTSVIGRQEITINDGRLMEKALRAQGLDRNWLEQRLAEHGVCSPSQVFLLTVDEAGSVCFVAREAV